MEEQYTEPEEQLNEEPVEIYSKRAIFGFSIFFNPVFGAALLMQNLRDVGYKKAGNQVFIFSILYYLAVLFVLKSLNVSVTVYFLIVLATNIGAGYIFINYIFPKYFPDDDYYPKNILRVLLRCIMIGLILTMLFSYLSTLPIAKLK